MAGSQHHNIEPSRFRKGEYVGYGHGTVWRITRQVNGWRATPRDGGGTHVSAPTLAGISARLSPDEPSSRDRSKRTKRDPSDAPPWWDMEESAIERELIAASERINFADAVMADALNRGVRAGNALEARRSLDAIERALDTALTKVRAAERKIRSEGLEAPKRRRASSRYA